MKRCHSCGTAWEGDKAPVFKEACDTCAAYLHSCKNCRLHDPHVHNQCISPTAEWVADREGPNWCDEFDFRVDGESRGEDEQSRAKDDWDKLFE